MLRPHPRRRVRSGPAAAPVRRSARSAPASPLDATHQRLALGRDLLAAQAQALLGRATLIHALGQQMVRPLRSDSALRPARAARSSPAGASRPARGGFAPARPPTSRWRARGDRNAPCRVPAPSAPAVSGAPGARELRGFGLALERTQARTCLALDIERAIGFSCVRSSLSCAACGACGAFPDPRPPR